ncbi:helix-turn-helix domain-containing protein [Clostridium sp. DSM 100503]|uniref:helix-turn-helix transcriptional regulator n=1 Tax=Clostridium sp. DSM 100503 TaxID=2963282 RepID=UPI00214A2106|nr:helix-turn-helix transcriptional regulator [Clostridium sp. DSM 100503]MCR1953174.1 helix-turn-helix domain-containing protein [Clostridium sp. DSM 100503]
MNERLRILRETLNLSQEVLGDKINVTRSHISSLEKGKRSITDRIVIDICREFNVNEEWLRNGTGEMFAKSDTFSLDDFLKKNNATALETNIIKAIVTSYFGVSEEFRDEFINKLIGEFKNSYSDSDNEITATKDIDMNSIDREVELYRAELIAEQKGVIYQVSEKSEELKKVEIKKNPA